MAVKPMSLVDHLKTHCDTFNYDDLVGAVISTETNYRDFAKALKTNFFDVFGFEESADLAIRDLSKIEDLLAKVKQRLAKSP